MLDRVSSVMGSESSVGGTLETETLAQLRLRARAAENTGLGGARQHADSYQDEYEEAAESGEGGEAEPSESFERHGIGGGGSYSMDDFEVNSEDQSPTRLRATGGDILPEVAEVDVALTVPGPARQEDPAEAERRKSMEEIAMRWFAPTPAPITSLRPPPPSTAPEDTSVPKPNFSALGTTEILIEAAGNSRDYSAKIRDDSEEMSPAASDEMGTATSVIEPKIDGKREIFMEARSALSTVPEEEVMIVQCSSYFRSLMLRRSHRKLISISRKICAQHSQSRPLSTRWQGWATRERVTTRRECGCP